MSLTQTAKIDRILAVDDSPDNLFLIQTILEDKGYDLITVEDGKSALVEVDKSPPDLILLDVMMPEMDGYEVTRRIRSNPQLPYIPILLITAHNQPSVVTGLDSGADDFIRKPVNMDELLARVRSLLRLKHSIDEREQLIRERDDFVSRLTHDLRTPLIAADRMFKLLQQGAFGTVASEMEEVLVTMIRSNQNLLQMVNSLLEVYRHEAGKKPMTFTTCDLRQLIQEVAQELMPLARERDLNLNLELEDTASLVNGDRLELQRVLTNLIGNAIKFTDRGAVSISLSATSAPHQALSSTQGSAQDAVQGFAQASGNQNSEHSSKTSTSVLTRWLRIDIQDTGQGISPADQAGLFKRFRQGQHKRSGSGLGLYLAHRIVQAHQGQLVVRSELGQGSTFSVYLPASA